MALALSAAIEANDGTIKLSLLPISSSGEQYNHISKQKANVQQTLRVISPCLKLAFWFVWLHTVTSYVLELNLLVSAISHPEWLSDPHTARTYHDNSLVGSIETFKI
jgi:hypothetical protein